MTKKRKRRSSSSRAKSKKRKPVRRQASNSRSRQTRKQVQSISRLEITGDVKNSIIMVLSSISVLPARIREHFALYRNQPSAIVLDIPWIGLFLSLLIAVADLLATLTYYGTSIDLLTSVSGLLVTWRINLVLLSISGVCVAILIAIQVGRTLRDHHQRSRKIKLIKRCSGIMPVIRIAGTVTLMTAFAIWLTGIAEAKMIKLRPDIAQIRVDKLVQAGQFDPARDILTKLPYERRAPAPPGVPSLRGVAIEADPIVPIKPVEDESWDWSLEEEEPTDPTVQALHTLGDIAEQLYEDGRYEGVIEAVCEMSHLGMWHKTLPYLRSAIYVMAHDPAWGTEKTLQKVKELWTEYPDCREMASPFWLAIPPELAWYIEVKQGRIFTNSNYGRIYLEKSRLPIEETVDQIMSTGDIRLTCQIDLSFKEVDLYSQEKIDTYSRRCEFDMRLMETLLEMYPRDEYADFARFLLGRYDEIITGGYENNGHVFDLAFYEKGRSQFQRGDYGDALKTFQAFLYAPMLREHPWRDDARWRVAECYKRLGRYVDALDNLARMEGEPDGEVPRYAEMAINALYIADVAMPIEDLAQVVAEEHFPTLQPLLKYTLAERLLAARRYEDSRRIFEEVIEEYGTRNVQIDPWKKGQVLLGDLAAKKIKVIDVLAHYERTRTEDSPLLLADYLETYDAFSPFENELRLYIPMFFDNDWQTVTDEYMTTRCRHYLSAQLREQFIATHPDDGRVPDLLLQIAKSYEAIASWEYLPPTGEFLDAVRQRAVDTYLTYIQEYPNHSEEGFDKALESSGSLFLARCRVGIPHPYSCDIDSVVGMREVYQRLVDSYPEHHLANNMLNWIAWTYCI